MICVCDLDFADIGDMGRYFEKLKAPDIQYFGKISAIVWFWWKAWAVFG